MKHTFCTLFFCFEKYAVRSCENALMCWLTCSIAGGGESHSVVLVQFPDISRSYSRSERVEATLWSAYTCKERFHNSVFSERGAEHSWKKLLPCSTYFLNASPESWATVHLCDGMYMKVFYGTRIVSLQESLSNHVILWVVPNASLTIKHSLSYSRRHFHNRRCRFLRT